MLNCTGATRSLKDARDYTIKVDSNTTFPAEFELKGMPKVKSQGSISSCTGFGVSTVAEYHHLHQHKHEDRMSAGFIYGYRQNILHKGKGLSIKDGLSTLKNVGIPFECAFPYNVEVPSIIKLVDDKVFSDDEKFDANTYANRCSCYFKLRSMQEVKYALMNYGPVLVSVNWYKSYNHATKIMKAEGKHSGRHCMVIYGWDQNGWKIQNSWGVTFGVNGRSVLPYNADINELWCVADDITDRVEIPVRNSGYYFKQAMYFFYNLFVQVVEAFASLKDI